MNNYLIQFNGDYGILQSDKTMQEVKMIFNENADISNWEKLEQIQRWAKEHDLNYIGHDMFYK